MMVRLGQQQLEILSTAKRLFRWLQVLQTAGLGCIRRGHYKRRNWKVLLLLKNMMALLGDLEEIYNGDCKIEL
jgi:hypothetical protein